ncbi:MatE efflux family protein [Oscillibacter valericigenes Sjm18-20]|nr:MatE efflux family protein [Oscillibacter valericigenes Sjm18-20]
MQAKQNTRAILLTGNPWKVMLSLSLPAIIGMVVIGLYNFMDAVFVGNIVGSVAMTAVKVSYPFTLLNSGVSTLLGVGSASVLSRAIGKNDQNTIDHIMGNLIMGIIVLSLIITTGGLIFTKQLLSLTAADEECMELAVRYLRIIFIGSLFVNFAQAANMVMRGEGILKKAMFFMGIGAVMNIILDPIFLVTTRSVEGAAYATVIAQITQAVITLWYFLKKSKNVRVYKICFDGAIMPEVLGVGVSAMLMQVMQMVQQTIMYRVAQDWGGGDWQTVLAAALSLQAFAFIPLWGISQGFQPAAGTNYGARAYDRVRKFMAVFCISATVLALIFYIPVMSAPKFMLGMFISDNPAAVEMGAPMLRLFFSTYITLGIMIMSITLFQALGKAKNAAVLTLLRQIVFFIPLAYLLPRVGSLGVTGLFLAPVVTDLGVLVLSFVMVFAVFRKMPRGDLPRMQTRCL